MHWTESYFESAYLQRWSLGPPTDRHHDEASWITEQLRPSDQQGPVVDVACGHGAYTVAMAARGHSVVGLDRSGALVERAVGMEHGAASAVSWIQADYRWLPVGSDTVAGAFLKDAFGFYEDERDNEAVLREIRRMLQPRARLVLAVVNAAPIRDNFVPTAEETRGGVVIRIRRTLLEEPLRHVERLEVDDHATVTAHERRQRLYTSEELGGLLAQTGFEIEALYGSCRGSQFEESTSGKSVFVAAAR